MCLFVFRRTVSKPQTGNLHKLALLKATKQSLRDSTPRQPVVEHAMNTSNPMTPTVAKRAENEHTTPNSSFIKVNQESSKPYNNLIKNRYDKIRNNVISISPRASFYLLESISAKKKLFKSQSTEKSNLETIRQNITTNILIRKAKRQARLLYKPLTSSQNKLFKNGLPKGGPREISKQISLPYFKKGYKIYKPKQKNKFSKSKFIILERRGSRNETP